MQFSRIQRLHIKHFRSIAEQSIELGDLTILVGQNAAGKSNVVDAIRFMRDAMAEGLDQAVSVRNGVRVVRQASHSKKPFNVELRLYFQIEDSTPNTALSQGVRSMSASYGFKFGSNNDELKVLEESGDLIHHEMYFDRDDDPIFYPVSTTWMERNKEGAIFLDGASSKRFVPVDELAMSRSYRFPMPVGNMLDTQTVFDLILADSRFAAIYPNVMRSPAPSQAAATLAEDCRNWASVIRGMQKTEEGQEGLTKVINLIRYVLPQLEDVAIKSVGGFLVPHFRFARGNGKRDMDLVPYQLSDGTLRLFGLLLALYQSPPASFLAIEEPEQMVHPGALRVLADAFKEAKERTQLLITTHSPYLLELFDLDSIRVVSQGENGTEVGPVSSKQLDIVRERLMTLPEIMVLDGLQPE
ncbi:AAA family ATPase [Lysobacter sp. CCNWLW3]|uniref:AAA family ATPase n=1 Tax=unclassified Lysobacter TaxID=2635362 RepID=UPI002FD39853